MSTVPAESQISDYLDRIRAALADLPAEARDELLEDLPGHLAEVLAEDAGTLTERLGEPEAYAAELRTAAGVGAAAAPARRLSRGSLRRAAGRADLRFGPTLGYRRVSDLLTQLRPGWWVLRGYLAGLLVFAVIFGSAPALPPARAITLVWLLLVLGGVIASVRLSHTSLRRAGRVALAVATVGLVGFAVAGLNQGRDRFEPTASTGAVDPCSIPRYSDVIDVYPYDANGHPLSGVRLYDQDGAPIVLGDPFRCGRPDLLSKPRAVDGPDDDVSRKFPALRRGYPLCPPTGWTPSSPTAPQPSPQPVPSPTR